MLEEHAMLWQKVVEAFPSTFVSELERLCASLGDALKRKPELFTCKLQFIVGKDVGHDSSTRLLNFLQNIIGCTVGLSIGDLRVDSDFSVMHILLTR